MTEVTLCRRQHVGGGPLHLWDDLGVLTGQDAPSCRLHCRCTVHTESSPGGGISAPNHPRILNQVFERQPALHPQTVVRMCGCRQAEVTGPGQTGVTLRLHAVEDTTSSYCLSALNVRRDSMPGESSVCMRASLVSLCSYMYYCHRW